MLRLCGERLVSLHQLLTSRWLSLVLAFFAGPNCSSHSQPGWKTLLMCLSSVTQIWGKHRKSVPLKKEMAALNDVWVMSLALCSPTLECFPCSPSTLRAPCWWEYLNCLKSFSMCTFIKRIRFIQIALGFIDLLYLSRHAGSWSVFHYVLSLFPSFFFLTHLLMSQMTACVTAICSHGNDSCTHARGIQVLAVRFLHNSGAVTALPWCAHLSILSELMILFLLASGLLHTLTHS